ncbi:MAG: DUF2244 domain-containing protein [Geminicoccaceae bacterium]
MAGGTPQQEPFEAVIYPNPPLGPKGTMVLFGGVAAVSFAMGAAFVQAGAWPVAGFFGLDVLLLVIAFRVVAHRSRRREVIRLDSNGLNIIRVSANGRQAGWRFEPYWVRVDMDDPPKPGSQLVVAQGYRRLRIGEFLTPAERGDLATALRAALRSYR